MGQHIGGKGKDRLCLHEHRAYSSEHAPMFKGQDNEAFTEHVVGKGGGSMCPHWHVATSKGIDGEALSERGHVKEMSHLRQYGGYSERITRGKDTMYPRDFSAPTAVCGTGVMYGEANSGVFQEDRVCCGKGTTRPAEDAFV